MRKFIEGYERILSDLLLRQRGATMPHYDNEYQSNLKLLCEEAYKRGLNVKDVVQLINEKQCESVDISMMASTETIPEQVYFKYFTETSHPNKMNRIGTGYILAAYEIDKYYDEKGQVENEYSNFKDGIGAVLKSEDISKLEEALLVIANSTNDKNHETEFGSGYTEEVPVYGEEPVGDTLYYISKNYPQYGSEFAIYTTKEAAERRSKELDEVYSDCFGDNQVYQYVDIKECNLDQILDRAKQIVERERRKKNNRLTYRLGDTSAFKRAIQEMAETSDDKASDLTQMTEMIGKGEEKATATDKENLEQ